MKRLVCELCGNPELIKENGLYNCPACGTKYTLEEAKKLMVEISGTVDVSGSTVKIDSSDDVENLYTLARRANVEKNSEQASKFYEQILLKRPKDWEATFYTTYYKAMQCKIAQIGLAADNVSNNLVSVFLLVKDLDIDKNERLNIVKEITGHCIYISVLLASNAKSNYDGIDNPQVKINFSEQYVDNIYKSVNILSVIGNMIESYYKDDEDMMNEACKAWKTAVTIHRENKFDKAIQQYVEKIKLYKPDYVQQKIEEYEPIDNDYRGCWIAVIIICVIIGVVLFLEWGFLGF